MGTEITKLRNLVQGYQQLDGRMYDILKSIITKLDLLDGDIESIRSEIEELPVGLLIAPDITTFTYTLNNRYVKLSWVQPDTTITSYEIRKGATWDAGSVVLKTTTFDAIFDPLTVGTHTYWIKGIDSNGNYSTNPKQLDVIIPALGNLTITADVIDNTVLLKWTTPTSVFEIAHYEIRRDATLIGTKFGTFTTVFESTSGTYSYKVKAFDIAGNISPESIVNATVRQPPDYSLYDSGIDDLLGTKVNTLVHNARLLCNVNLTETWQDHYINNSWNTPQDQINAGFPIYIQPALLTGSYEKIFDFGVLLSNVIINTIWNENQVAGSTVITSEISTSTDNITYTTPVSSRTLYSTSLRYVKVKIIFTGATTAALLEFYEFIVNLDVKRETDAGQITANSGDASGTVVTFGKSFKDIDSIEATVKQTVERMVVIDFVDAPNPTDFKVLVFNKNGVRQTDLVHWIAKGVV